ncbi:MAG: membrane protein insertase YidC [Longimicrobiales bacterium]
MEGARFLIAIVLSIAVVIAVNLMFPPTVPQEGPAADTVDTTTRVDTVIDTVRTTVEEPAAGIIGRDTAPTTEPEPAPVPAGPVADQDSAAPADTLWVENGVARYGFSTRGGSLVSVELLNFESFTRDGPVQLVDETVGSLLQFGVRAGDQDLPLTRFRFQSSVPVDDTLRVSDTTTVRFTASVNGAAIELAYEIRPDRYEIPLDGRVQGVGDDAILLVDLGPRLAVNEADSAEDLRALAYVVNSRQEGIENRQIDDLEEDRVEEGPLNWVALKNKYFVAAAIQPENGAFGGVLATGGPAGAEQILATLPLDASGAFNIRLFFGPQEFERLAAVQEGLQEVNPYGWRIFRPIIRPLAEIITWLLTALHNVLGFGYGWVLILFGFAMRGLLWPLNAKAQRSQLKTMELQPRIKEIQEKYKEHPEQLQKEMMRLYKEEGFNPLGGCLPMLIPWPVLITLFFVFQNTIEFRGVEFLWLPDLSRPDPLYILPVVLGLSLFALQFMNVRATGSDNPQQKMLMWFMPIMMMVIFLNFASGLNLYYAASNIASLPQQIQIIGERKRAKAKIAAKKEDEDGGDGKGKGGKGGKGRKKKGG